MGKEIFISHAWGYDELERDNHNRYKEIADKLIQNNYGVWFDDYDMYGIIDNAIMRGINNCKIFILCLTKKYCDKINNAVNNNFLNDNCYKEWNYCLFKQKIIIPIIMEPCMKNIYFQDGIIQMYLYNVY
uniref:Toll-like receptor n=1 Tax=Nucleocytoviricota sp. TaxID=2809609 RepID=A0A9E8JZ86_9VIRU|nr:toll-like receptor [Nucleocytoviricota sp.]UZT29068.1 toll-like receptor [Nucleocytoviricota sp.]